MDGILNLYKPSGPTSHDVVNTVRRASKQRRVGHAGTLDPAASGVLIVCLGQATRVVENMADQDKEYCAEITFGQTTNTYDADGQPTSDFVPPAFGLAEITAATSAFVGEIQQVPPVYSAIKQGGQPLYRLARSGQEVTPTPRRVHIYSIDVLEWQAPNLTAKVRCSKGTYIRSLAHDLGQCLGSGAYLRSLVRLASGRFRWEDALTLEEMQHAFAEGYITELLYPLDEALLETPAVVLGDPAVSAVRHGNRWYGPSSDYEGQQVRAYDTDGQLIAVLQSEKEPHIWHPRKVFNVGT